MMKCSLFKRILTIALAGAMSTSMLLSSYASGWNGGGSGHERI